MSPDAPELFAVLAHDTRLRVLLLLLEQDELCVCELTHALGVTQPHLSRHLAHLRDAGLVADRRAGQWVHYRLHRDLPAWARGVLDAVAAGPGREPPFIHDRDALAAMPNRPGAPRCA